MPPARNQEVTVRRPLAKRSPHSSRGKRQAVRRSSQQAKAAKALVKNGGRCEKDRAGSWTEDSSARVIVSREPAFVHPPPSFLGLPLPKKRSETACGVAEKWRNS